MQLRPRKTPLSDVQLEIVTASSTGIQRALSILRQGGIVAHATETCYGFACDLRNPDAVKKLFAIKQRPLDQPVSALFASVDDAKKYVEWNDEAQRLADEYLPGPLTMILHLKNNSGINPVPVPSPIPTLGIRISSHPIAMELVKRFGSPLSTTSGNLHGQSNPYSAEDIVRQFTGKEFQPDLILDSGELPRNPPSTVIDLTDAEKSMRREGSVKISAR